VNPNITDIRTYTYRKLDRFFLDANIWLVLYGPLPKRDWRTDVYNQALGGMKRQRCEIWVDVLVFSEFINTLVQKEYVRITGKLPDDWAGGFKAVRNSPQFRPVAEEVAAACRNILKVATRCATGFETVEVDALLAEFEQCRLDFNDQMIAQLCKTKGLTLVTHDVDFKESGLHLLTANPRLLTP